METPPIHVLLALDAQILGGEAEISTGDEGSSRSTTEAAQDDGPGRQLDSDQYLPHGRQLGSGQSPVASV